MDSKDMPLSLYGWRPSWIVPKKRVKGIEKFEPYDYLVIWSLMMPYPPLTQFGQTNLANSIFVTSQPPLTWYLVFLNIVFVIWRYFRSRGFCPWMIFETLHATSIGNVVPQHKYEFLSVWHPAVSKHLNFWQYHCQYVDPMGLVLDKQSFRYKPLLEPMLTQITDAAWQGTTKQLHTYCVYNSHCMRPN